MEVFYIFLCQLIPFLTILDSAGQKCDILRGFIVIIRYEVRVYKILTKNENIEFPIYYLALTSASLSSRIDTISLA